MYRMDIFANEPTGKKGGQQEEAADRHLFDCEALG